MLNIVPDYVTVNETLYLGNCFKFVYIAVKWKHHYPGNCKMKLDIWCVENRRETPEALPRERHYQTQTYRSVPNTYMYIHIPTVLQLWKFGNSHVWTVSMGTILSLNLNDVTEPNIKTYQFLWKAFIYTNGWIFIKWNYWTVPIGNNFILVHFILSWSFGVCLNILAWHLLLKTQNNNDKHIKYFYWL